MIPFSFLAGLSWFLKHRLVFPLKPQTAAPHRSTVHHSGEFRLESAVAAFVFPFVQPTPSQSLPNLLRSRPPRVWMCVYVPALVCTSTTWRSLTWIKWVTELVLLGIPIVDQKSSDWVKWIWFTSQTSADLSSFLWGIGWKSDWRKQKWSKMLRLENTGGCKLS